MICPVCHARMTEKTTVYACLECGHKLKKCPKAVRNSQGDWKLVEA